MNTSFNDVQRNINDENVEVYRRFLRGHSGFYCKKCFKPIVVRLNVENDHECDADLFFGVEYHYSFKCPDCGAINKYNYEIDPNITPTIALLNKKGYKTKFCCEGHYTDEGAETAYIFFDKVVPVNIADKYPLPFPWYRDTEIQKGFNCSKVLIIRAHTDTTTLKQRMEEIYKWAESLPELKNYTSKDLLVIKEKEDDKSK